MGEFTGRGWQKLAANLSFGAGLMEEERRRKKKGSIVRGERVSGRFQGQQEKEGGVA